MKINYPIEETFVFEFNKNPQKVIDELNYLYIGGYLNRKQHPVYENLYLYNYNQKTTFERYWNLYTLSCRGLVIDTKAKKIIALPFAKFFNYRELENTRYYQLSTAINNRNFDVYEKLDGSLAIGFVYNEQIHWCTRGSFESEQANYLNRYFRNNYTENELEDIAFDYTNMTLLAEVIYPDNKIVVDYGGKHRMPLLAIIRNKDGKFLPYADVCHEASLLKVECVKKYSHYASLHEIVKESSTWTHNTEGVVIVYDNGKRIKVKGEQYLTVHKLLYSASVKSKVQAWKDGTTKELLMGIPEEFRKDYEDLIKLLNLKLENFIKTINKYYKEILLRELPRKNIFGVCQKYYNLNPFETSLIFKLLDGEDITESVREYIYKNYSDFVKGD